MQSNLDLLLIDDEQAQASGVEIDEDWEALLSDEFEGGVRITEPEKRKGEKQSGPGKQQKSEDPWASSTRKLLMLQKGGPGESLHQRIEHQGRKEDWSLNPLFWF